MFIALFSIITSMSSDLGGLRQQFEMSIFQLLCWNKKKEYVFKYLYFNIYTYIKNMRKKIMKNHYNSIQMVIVNKVYCYHSLPGVIPHFTFQCNPWPLLYVTSNQKIIKKPSQNCLLSQGHIHSTTVSLESKDLDVS